jgi:serine/threonine-protein kinase
MIGQILGHYRILEKIGEGGMGKVYRARDERLDRDVALKLLPPGLLGDEATRKRFRREAQTLAKLSHANIGMVFDFDTRGDTDFLVMEFIEGESLAERLAHGAMDEREVAKIGSQVAAALEAAHERGVVHRDLKPGNVMVTRKGQAKVLDFGLAKLLPAAGDDPTEVLTKPQVAVGTLPYMTPEQLRGDTVDARSDIFALGTVLFEMATGRRPFADPSAPRVIENILHRQPPSPRSLNGRVSPELERIVLKCLEKDPENRYQSVRELEIDLRRFYLPTTAAATLPAARPRPVWLKLTAASALGAFALAALLFAVDAGGVRSRVWGGDGVPQIESLAVLPLSNLSGNTGQEYFVDGMTEALITELARVRSLKVISRTSVMRYKGTQKRLPEIAHELGVDAVVEGSVLREGNRVRITAQLIHARSDAHLWANSFDADLKDVLNLQSEIARAVANQIRTALTPSELATLSETRTVNPEAYDEYLRGRAAFYQYDDAGLREATERYNKALGHDPEFAPAYAGLALVYAGYINLGMSTDAAYLTRAESLAREAIRRRPNLGEGHFALGFALSMGGNWVPAREAYLQAVGFEPNHAHAHAGLGYVYENSGFLERAEEESKRARLLDPQLGPPYWHLNAIYHARGDHRRALQVIEDSPVRDWGLSSWQRAREFYELGELGKVQELVRQGPALGWQEGSMGAAAALLDYKAGRMETARKRMSVIKMDQTSNPRSASLVASLYAVGGDTERSLQWLELAVWRGYANYPLLASGSEFAAMRKNAKFQKLLAEVKSRHDQCKAVFGAP